MRKELMSLVEALPPEIIGKITSILPVESIINCMLVCKLWRALIPNKNPFLAKHNPNYFLLCNLGSARFAILDHDYDYDDPSCITEDQVIPMKPSFLSYGRSERIHIWGSCNRLICFSSIFELETRNIHIYNPIIGESVTVPKPNQNYTTHIDLDQYAFGFCPVTNHYKVFRLAYSQGNYNNLEIEIYTLGSQRWRHIGHVSRQIWYQSNPICAGGVFHWMWSTKDEEKLFTFNLATEEFGSAAPPPIGRDKSMRTVGYMDHCLIPTAGPRDYSVTDMDIWVRKELTWTKNWVVPVRDNGVGCLRNLIPSAISADGIILMIHPNGRLYSFDPTGKRGTALVRAIFPSPWSGLVPYDATLVSPRDLMKDVSS